MKITLDIPPVSTCTARECAYNLGNQCHAGAITIGDGLDPICGTYFHSTRHPRASSLASGAGPCNVVSCRNR